jgi:hypothetical protein
MGVKHGRLSRVSGPVSPSAFIVFFFSAISIYIYIPHVTLWQVTFVVNNFLEWFTQAPIVHNYSTDMRITRYDSMESATSLTH